MRILVFAHRRDADAALEKAADLRASGHTASYRDTRGFGSDLELCDLVLTDDPIVWTAYRARDIEVNPLTTPEDEPEPADADEGGDPESTPPAPRYRPRRQRRAQ